MTITGNKSANKDSTNNNKKADSKGQKNKDKENQISGNSKLTKDNVSANDEDKFKKFEDEGVVFKAKMIGSELVMEPTGDKMCQNSIQRLKAIIKGTNSHKKRVVLKISYDGVKVYDEKTNEILHHHEVAQISYIASDDTDSRTFGYVSDVPNKAHQFICFKTSGPAITVMSVISSLFEAVLEKKNKAEKDKEGEKPKVEDGSTKELEKADVTDSIFILNSDIDLSFASSSKIEPPPQPIQKQQTIIKQSSIDDLIGDSGIIDADLSIFNDVVSKPAPQPVSPAQNINQNAKQNNNSSGHVDRYAVFNDIDSLPSIFESTSLGNVNKIDQHSQNINVPINNQPPIFTTANNLTTSRSQQQLHFALSDSTGFPNNWQQTGVSGFDIGNLSFHGTTNAMMNAANAANNQSGPRMMSGIQSMHQPMQPIQPIQRQQTNPFDDDFFA